MTPAKTIRGYELREQIGRGGFGVVYRAYQPIVDREVAIKVILPQFVKNPDFVRNFETEAQVIARLAHPFVVPLFDYWREPEGAYLVMRYLSGGSWRQRLKADAPLAPAHIAPMLLQVAAALDAAHRAQIIHRDIKPENILLDDEGNTYLADFGIAKKLDPTDDSERGQFRGTLAYTAPEIIESSNVSPASDLYSLGYTLHEMLTGKHILSDVGAAAVLAWHLESTLPDIEGMPLGVNAVLQRATAKDPSARYASAQSLAREFYDAVNQTSTTAFASPTLNLVTNPYKGLRPFDEADTRDFFGREGVVAQILSQLAQKNFITVVGPSGSGKSSVVRAGVLPALREGGLPGSADWFIVTMMPGAHPLQQLKTALLKVAFDPTDTLTHILARETGLTEAIVDVLDIQNPLLLVIDQFEEVFTLVEDESERQHFLDLLSQAAGVPNTRLKVLITLRADFYDRPLLYENFGALVQDATQVVLPLKTDELQQAITNPARRVGISFDSELIAAIVSDVRQEPGALPLLQYALTELFEKREGNRLALSAYQDSGGVSGALARRAEDVYQELPAEQQLLARQMFLRLVNPGDGTEDTRRRARYSELIALHKDRKSIQAVLDAFGKYRLLTFDNDIETREPTIDVAHEALIREWQRLRGWLNESRNDLRLQRMLSTLMQEWRTARQDKSFLLHGTRLAQFEDWAKTSSLTPSQDENMFLEASLAEHRQRQAAEAERQARELALERRSHRRLQAFVGLLVVASCVGLGLTVQIYNESRNATRRADEANSLRLASKAQQVFGEGDTIQALSLAFDAVEIENPLQETVETLVEVAYAPGLYRLISTGDQAISALAISSDGQYILTGTGESVSPNQGPPPPPPPPGGGQGGQGGPPPGGQGGPPPGGQGGPPPGGGQGGPPPGGQGGQGGPPPAQAEAEAETYTLALWDLHTGEEIARLEDTSAAFTDLLFLPQTDDTLKAISASVDGRVVLWDVMAAAPLHDIQLPAFDKITLSMAENGLLLIVGAPEEQPQQSPESLLMLIDTTTWAEPRRISQHQQRVRTGQISHDGTFAISSALDGTQVIWDTTTGEELRRFKIDTSSIKPQSYHVQIAPDDASVVITTGETHTWLWRIEDGTLLGRLPSGTVVTQRAVFTPDEKALVIASQDGIVRLWDIEDGVVIRELLDRSTNLESLALNGRYAVTGTISGDVYIWDIEPTYVYQKQTFTGQPSKRVEFVPNTNQILTFASKASDAGRKSVLTLWDITTGDAVRVFGEGHNYVPQSLAVSADGRFALTGTVTRAPGLEVKPGMNNEMILWDLATGEEVRRLSRGDTANTLDIAFHPTNANVALATHDRDILLWQLDKGIVTQVFTGHVRHPKSIAFLPDGTSFVSVGADDLRVWDLESGEVIRSFAVEGNQEFLCLTPDGGAALLSGADVDETILLDLATGETQQTLKGHTDGILSCDVSPDGRMAMTGSWDNTFILWDVATGHIIRRYTEHNAAIWDVAFSTDSRTMLSVGEGAGVVLWRTDPVTIAETMAWVAEHRQRVAAASVSP